jgi:hypothetical protein
MDSKDVGYECVDEIQLAQVGSNIVLIWTQLWISGFNTRPWWAIVTLLKKDCFMRGDSYCGRSRVQTWDILSKNVISLVSRGGAAWARHKLFLYFEFLVIFVIFYYSLPEVNKNTFGHAKLWSSSFAFDSGLDQGVVVRTTVGVITIIWILI